MEFLIHGDDERLDVLYKNLKFIIKFFDQAFEYYGVATSTNQSRLELDDNYIEIINKERPAPDKISEETFSDKYLDLTRAFRYYDAVVYVLQMAERILGIMENSKYEKFFRGKKSDGAINEALVVVRESQQLYPLIKSHINLHKYQFFRCILG